MSLFLLVHLWYCKKLAKGNLFRTCLVNTSWVGGGGSCHLMSLKLMQKICSASEEGMTPNFLGWDAHQKISVDPLRGTNLGVAQVDFKP